MSKDHAEIEYQGIRYRATRTDDEDANGVIWSIESKQREPDPWEPRGIFHERHDKFRVGGKEFDSAIEALRYHARM